MTAIMSVRESSASFFLAVNTMRLGNGSRHATSVLMVGTFFDIRTLRSLTSNVQGNGVAKRFVLTLKADQLWVRRLESAEKPSPPIVELRDNHEEITCRHGYTTPAVRRSFQKEAVPIVAWFAKSPLLHTAGRQAASNMTRNLLR